MNTTVLLTLGRLPKALELTRGLHRAGCRVIVAEPFGWHVCRLSRSVAKSYRVAAPNSDPAQYARDLVGIVEREGVDIVVPVSEEAIHTMAIRDQVPNRVRFYSPPAETLMALHDKHGFARLAVGHGLDVPPTLALHDPDAAALAADRDVVVKPTHGCSGIGMQILRRGSRLPAADADRPAIVQGFVDGRHVSTFSIAHEGALRTTVLYEGTLFSGTVAVCFRRIEALACVTDWVTRFVQMSRFSGFVSFDFIVDGDGRAWAIECNPRVTSGVHFLEPDGLAQAVLDPGGNHPLPLRSRAHFQQFFPALTETYKYVLRPRRFVACFRQLLAARDVVWSLSDPLPFLLMTPASWAILRQTMFQGRSFGDAATRDIAWFGGTMRAGCVGEADGAVRHAGGTDTGGLTPGGKDRDRGEHASDRLSGAAERDT